MCGKKQQYLISAGLCWTASQIWKLTRWTEASIHTVIITQLASLGIAAGVSTRTAAFPILHVERACFCYSTHTQKKYNLETVTDINTAKKIKQLEHVNALFADFTTQLCGLPCLWVPSCIGAMMGVLWYGWTQAWSAATVTVAHVFYTGFDEGVGINQVLTAEERMSWQEVLTEVFLWGNV